MSTSEPTDRREIQHGVGGRAFARGFHCAWLLLGAVHCTALIEGGPNGNNGNPGTLSGSNGSGSTSGSNAGDGPGTGTGNGTGTMLEAFTCASSASPDPGPAPLRLLSRTQYLNTL